MNIIRQTNQMLLYRNNNNLLYKSLYFCGIGHLAFWGFFSFQLYPQLDQIVESLNKEKPQVTKDELVNVLGLTTSIGLVILGCATIVSNRNIQSLTLKNNKLYLKTFSLIGRERMLENVSTCKYFPMDLVLNLVDPYLDDYYSVPRDNTLRQLLSLWLISIIGVTILYFVFSTLSFYTVFDRSILKHPKFLKNQIAREIKLSLYSFPITSMVTVPWFYFEINGYSKLYHDVGEYGYPYLIFSLVWFILFTDFGVYWIHRYEHHPLVYSWLHKQHHMWKVTTPFASFAFHPLDGYVQSLPMHVFVYLFPMNSYLYLTMFILIQFWTISIHDGVYISNDGIINSAAHHTVHHLEFNYNYGQYFTLWDRIGKSYKYPKYEFDNNMFFEKMKRGGKTKYIGKEE
ncbi:c-5 sterol desaturase [Boothiomyces sp. JEL0838]|nr:c-5 sterol desaturase [Boothiomyces sp. JEL0838]